GLDLPVSVGVDDLAFEGRNASGLINLYDFRNRRYSAALGRFIQEDFLSPFGYVFVGNGPLTRKDPLGASEFLEELGLEISNHILPPGLNPDVIGSVCFVYKHADEAVNLACELREIGEIPLPAGAIGIGDVAEYLALKTRFYFML